MINKNNYGKGSDVWAAGLIIYKLLTNNHPLIDLYGPKVPLPEVRERIENYKHLEFPADSKVSPQARHLLERMLAKEQSGRYSAAEALKHPWITRRLEEEPPMTRGERQLENAETYIANE